MIKGEKLEKRQIEVVETLIVKGSCLHIRSWCPDALSHAPTTNQKTIQQNKKHKPIGMLLNDWNYSSYGLQLFSQGDDAAALVAVNVHFMCTRDGHTRI